ncbi:hypothetical protein HPB47_020371, partial [Ixodes persulcatus]
MVHLTPSERAKVVLWYGECHRTKQVRRRFRTEFRRRPPSSPAILRWLRRFEENRDVGDKERTRLSPSQQQVFLKNAILANELRSYLGTESAIGRKKSADASERSSGDGLRARLPSCAGHVVATALYAALNRLAETDLPQQWLQRPKSSMPRQVARLGVKRSACYLLKRSKHEECGATRDGAGAPSRRARGRLAGAAGAPATMRRQPDLLDAALQASRTSLDPGSIPNGAVTTARAESKAPSPSAFAAAGPPRPSVGGLSPMAQPPPPAEERLLPNGNVCHFAGCGCADGVSGEIRAALKECVSNMRQQQQLQQQQQQQQQAGGPCGCPSLLRGACEHQSRQQVPPAPQPLKSLLKRPSTARPRRGSRVRFSDTLTVFSEDYPEAQLYVIRTAELTFAEVCSMYEPPPEYRDLPPFDPPDGYRDDAYLLPFLKEARAAAAAARAAAAAANGNNQTAVPQGTAVGAPASQPALQGPTAGPQQVKVAERPPPPPPPPRPAFINARGTVREDARLPPPPPPVRLEITPVETKLKVDIAEADSTRTEENVDKASTPAAEAEDVKTVVVVSEEEGRSEDEDPAVIVEDEDEAILLELKKQLECNNGGDIEADLAELLPPGLVLADVDKDLDDDIKVCFEKDRKEDLGDSAAPLVTVSAPAVTTVTSSSPTTPTTPTSDERQDDSDSSADSQDTIILMTNEEEKKIPSNGKLWPAKKIPVGCENRHLTTPHRYPRDCLGGRKCWYTKPAPALRSQRMCLPDGETTSHRGAAHLIRRRRTRKRRDQKRRVETRKKVAEGSILNSPSGARETSNGRWYNRWPEE